MSFLRNASSMSSASAAWRVFLAGKPRTAQSSIWSMEVRGVISRSNSSRLLARRVDGQNWFCRSEAAFALLSFIVDRGARRLALVRDERGRSRRINVVFAGNAHQAEQAIAAGVGQGGAHAVRRGRWDTGQTGQSEDIHSPEECANTVVNSTRPASLSTAVV